MAEPDEIIEFIESRLNTKLKLSGKTALVTAGPTYEAIDPVRFIGNHSSGKMGVAIAEELANNGAKVILVCGPVNIDTIHPNIKRFDVESAEQMYKKCIKEFKGSDIAVMAAAVADYAPAKAQKKKIKKTEQEFNALDLVPTKDILKELGKLKTKKQVLVGFALETDNELENAQKKLKNKNLDLIVLNSLKDKGAGFKHDSNKVTMVHKNNKITKFELRSKTEVAKDIVEEIKKMI